MTKESRIPLSLVANTSPLRKTIGSLLHLDGGSDACRDLGTNTVSKHEQQSSFQAKEPFATARRIQRYWTTEEIHLVPAVSLQTIIWKQEAAYTNFLLDPALFANMTHERTSSATGELVWVCWEEQPASCPASVRPTLLVRAFHASASAAHLTIIPTLPAHDPLLQHIALVLQTKIEGKSAADLLYAELLINALAVHFLKRYATSRHSQEVVTGGLSPYKLRRTTTYIKEHLTQELSLVTLAAVGETSPAHFARLFKHTTGYTHHQYVLRRRMDQTKRLLAETDVSLSEIGLQVGCADQSHFTALFRKHISMTPKAYRDNAKMYASLGRRREEDPTDT